jgi:hypothetical protein
VAISGDYNDLINSPTLSNVASSGNYNDLINSPILSNVASSGNYDDLFNSPILSNVAISGDYNDLINLPNLEAITNFVPGNVEHWTDFITTIFDAVNNLAQRVSDLENPT